MPHYEDDRTKMLGRALGDLVAMQEAIVDADTELVGWAEFGEMKQYFRDFEAEDRKYLDSFREVVKAFDLGKVGPDQYTQDLIGLCKRVFTDANVPAMKKVGCYGMLLTAVKEGSYLLSNIATLPGKEDLGCRITEVFHGIYGHAEMINTAVHRKAKDMAKSFQPVGATARPSEAMRAYEDF